MGDTDWVKGQLATATQDQEDSNILKGNLGTSKATRLQLDARQQGHTHSSEFEDNAGVCCRGQ